VLRKRAEYAVNGSHRGSTVQASAATKNDELVTERESPRATLLEKRERFRKNSGGSRFVQLPASFQSIESEQPPSPVVAARKKSNPIKALFASISPRGVDFKGGHRGRDSPRSEGYPRRHLPPMLADMAASTRSASAGDFNRTKIFSAISKLSPRDKGISYWTTESEKDTSDSSDASESESHSQSCDKGAIPSILDDSLRPPPPPMPCRRITYYEDPVFPTVVIPSLIDHNEIPSSSGNYADDEDSSSLGIEVIVRPGAETVLRLGRDRVHLSMTEESSCDQLERSIEITETSEDAAVCAI